jgi:serine hydrolase
MSLVCYYVGMNTSKPSNIFIFHGTEGHPLENWFPWLKQELEEKDYHVIVPQFPTPPVVAAKISEWFDVLKDYEQCFNENTVMVGHSLGGVFTLRVLEQLDHPIKAALLVGTPIGAKPILNYGRDSSFSGFEFDWENIKNKAEDFVVYQSDNDPYVGLDNGKELAKHLGVELSFIPNAGHFNEKAGYTTFEDLKGRLFRILGEA